MRPKAILSFFLFLLVLLRVRRAEGRQEGALNLPPPRASRHGKH